MAGLGILTLGPSNPILAPYYAAAGRLAAEHGYGRDSFELNAIQHTLASAAFDI